MFNVGSVARTGARCPARDSVYTPGCKGCKVGGEIAQQSLSDPRGGENKDEKYTF